MCDIPLEARALNDWSNHVFKAEQLFLENIYTEKQVKIMSIYNFEVYSDKLNKILDKLDAFINSIESENIKSIKKDEENSEIEAIVEKIKKN